MASLKHQFIIDCIIRKMRSIGFEPVCVDGNSTLVSSLNMPQSILRHRPDIIAIDKNDNICIGEAKTKNDLSSKRTKEQIIDYNKSGAFSLFGCQKSMSFKLIKIMDKIVPDNYGKNIILKIPDELMPSDEI